MRVPDEEEDPHQNDGVPPLRVPESDQTNQKMIPVLIPAQKTINTQINKPTEKPMITFQNTTGPTARKRRRKKSKEGKKKQTKDKQTLQTVAYVGYHGNTLNPDTQQIVMDGTGEK